jgi:cystathionine beta-lyase
MTDPVDPATFETVVERRGTASTKWTRYLDADRVDGPWDAASVLPFWVADMEFPAPAPVLEALHARVDHGIFGYTRTPESMVEAALEFLRVRYDWHVDPDWLVWIPGVVPGLNLACRAVGAPGDGVVVPVPVYYPFLSVPANADRRRIEVPAHLDDGRWTLDPAELDAAAEDASLLLLCNPQNPTGRILDDDELGAIAAVAERRDLVICSDEIHAELLLDERPHRPIATLDPAIAARTITLMAPTKTFNIAGLPCAWAVIPDPALRRRFRRSGAGLTSGIAPLAYTAAEAALRHGEPWRRALLDVLRRNRDRLQAAVDELPGLSMTRVEATCLAWIDCREAGLEDPAAFFEAGGVGLSPGPQFGGTAGTGDGFVRFNFGCAPAMLEEGIARMARRLAEGNRP